MSSVADPRLDATVDDLKKKFIGATAMAVYDKKKTPAKVKVLAAGTRYDTDKAQGVQVDDAKQVQQ